MQSRLPVRSTGPLDVRLLRACNHREVASKATPLTESHPEVAARWVGNVDPDDLRHPGQFSVKARMDCWWWCGVPGHAHFTAVPFYLVYGIPCLTCRQERDAERRRVEALPVAGVPELVAAWRDPRPFAGLRVGDLFGGVAGKNLGQTYALRCPNNHKIDTVVGPFVFEGCPWCRSADTRKVNATVMVAGADPELAAIWHPTRNGDMTPQNTPYNYRKPLWWKSVQCCGYEWKQRIGSRTLGRRPQAGAGHFYCPKCESVWGSLAWMDPVLATEWHPDNELTAWHVKPFSGGVVVKWRCSTDPGHVWEESVIARSAGRLCPQCSTAGTSQIEQAFAEAAQQLDPAAAAGRVGRWRVDVLVPSLNLIVEYDGEYWHDAKQDTDERKTRELIQAGYLVARIRENELPHLAMADPHLRQVSFWPAVGRVADTMQVLIDWAKGP